MKKVYLFLSGESDCGTLEVRKMSELGAKMYARQLTAGGDRWCKYCERPEGLSKDNYTSYVRDYGAEIAMVADEISAARDGKLK